VEFSDFFQEALMEQLETFIESFITNMPDILRRLRVDEDEQRQLNSAQDHDLDLERFIVTISYAYEGRPKAAAEGFWGVPDGSLIGFMHWASRRASTPLVSSFCEMLQAISEDEECATAAHLFLLDEGAQGSGKIRRPHSLTWNQIFKELTFFSTKIRDRPAAPQTYGVGKPNNDLAEMEPESLMMLECYLRLITRLCTSSTTARQYLVQHPSFHLVDLSFQLASSSIQPRLKACAFTTLGSLIAHKTKEAGEHMWIALDLWVSGGFAPLSHMSKSQVPVSMAASASSSDRILKSLNTGFEEPNSFIQFLLALVLPNEDESGLHDGLPFPETLGITTRMPGIDRYIDFAIGQVFGDQIAELNDVVQIRLLQLTCLDFIGTCLGTFNEDLVIFANESNISIDIAIHASNLKSYVLLHPFARVMEWMFHEKVMKALFTAVHQDPAQIARSAPDSPLILCLLRSIRVIALILDLQPTYLDIVRPLVKIQSTHLRIPVSNASFASFEDGVLNHLSIIADLGLYCGMGQPELTLASLKLLEKLSASSRLASATGTGFGRRAERNKIIAALESENYSDTISKSLLHEMKSNIDLNLGRLDSAYIVKLHILDFLAACLRASPDQPTIAHVLLGFQCSNNLLDVDPHGPFIRGISLFHTILEVAVDTPVGEEINVVSSWLVSLRCKALDVLSLLWKSPLSSEFVMAEMRSNQSLFLLFVRQPTIKPETIWDGRSSRDPELLVSQSTSCVSDFLRQRSFTLQYVSSELRLVARGHLPSLKTRILGTLQGSTIEDDGQQTENFTIFDMFDFMELEFGEPISAPPLSWIKHADLDVCIERHEEPAASTHDLIKIHEILLLKRAELVKQNLLTDPQDAALVDSQIAETLEFYAINNQLNLFGASRLNLLRSWVQLVHVILESGELVGQDKILFVLRTLQTIQPSLESMLHIEKQATELARLAKSLVFSLDFDSEAFKMGDMGDLVSERLFHLFQVALRAIDAMGSHPALKELFYNISYRYLTGMSDVAGVSGIHLRHSIQTIKAAGDRFIDSVCDDAYGGDPLCRISALILLTALVQLAGREKSKYMVESLGRLNFINILVDSIQNFSNDLSQTAREGAWSWLFFPDASLLTIHLDVNLHISYCNARLALLLRVSQSRFGATAVLNAGLFHSVRSSGLFVIDPDLGIGKKPMQPAWQS
jgi:nuclear pore complex protein Nup205